MHNKGRRYETEATMDYAWQDNAPINLTIYLLQRLLCSECKTSFTATSSFEGFTYTVGGNQDQMKAGIVDANAGANAMVAGILERRGMALTDSNHDTIIKQLACSAAPVRESLIRMVTNSELQ